MGLGPIPSSSILAYAREYDLNRDDTTSFVDIIRSMDSEFLQLSNKKLSKRNKREEKAEKIAQEADEVSTTDLRGVREVLGRLKTRAASAKKRTVKETDSGNS